MNAASRWRLELAKASAGGYRHDHLPVAIAVTGSVSRGWADRYSDIELAAFWREVPPPEVRRLPAAARERDVGQNPELGCWDGECEVHGVKLDLQHWAIGHVEHVLADVLQRFDISPAKQAFAAALRDAIPLAGSGQLEMWRQRLDAYPDGLAVAMVNGHVKFGPHRWVDMLAERDDVLALGEIRPIAARNILGCLLGVNRMYHPGTKWLWRTLASMDIRPPALEARLRRVLVGEPAVAATALKGLIDDTLALVEEHVPAVNTGPSRARLLQGRPVWDLPPPGIKRV